MNAPHPTYQGLWRIAWPVMAASLSQNLASIIDTLFLGYVGEKALAAGAIGVILFLVLGFVGLGMGTGIQVLAAHLLGEKRPHHLGDLFTQSLQMGLAVGVFLAIATFFAAPPLVTLLVSDKAVEDIATYFVKWRSMELFPLILFGILRGYFSGIAYTRPIFHANLILSVVAILLNLLLVQGYQWGVRGVVVSSITAQYVATAYLFYALRWQPHDLRPVHQTLWGRPFLRYAGPAVLQNVVGMAGWFVFFLVIERRGSLALASANIVRTLYSFAMLPTWAYATAVGTLMGYFWAARSKPPLLQSLRKALKLSLLTNLLIVLSLLCLAPLIVPLFTSEAAIQAQVQKDLYMIAVSLLLMPASSLLISAVVAVGLVLQAFIVEVAIIGLYVLYVLLLAEGLGASLTLLWSAEWVYWVPSAAILGVLLRRRLRHLTDSAAVLPQPVS